MRSKVFSLRKYEENKMPFFSIALQSNLSLPFVTNYFQSLRGPFVILIRQTELSKTDI